MHIRWSNPCVSSAAIRMPASSCYIGVKGFFYSQFSVRAGCFAEQDLLCSFQLFAQLLLGFHT